MTESRLPRPFSARPAFGESFHRHAARAPDAPALWWRGEAVTYRMLARSAVLQGAELSRWPEGPVCVAAHASPGAIAAALGALAAGRCVFFHCPGLAEAEAARFAGSARSLVGWREGEGWVAIASVDDPLAEAVPPRLAGLGYVELSGEAPTLVDSAALERLADFAYSRLDVGPGRCVLGHARLGSELSLLELWTPLMLGATVALVDRSGVVDPRGLHSLIVRHGVHLVQGAPAFHELMTRSLGRAAMPSVERLVVAGGPLRPDCRARLPTLFPRARAHSLQACNATGDCRLQPLEPAISRPVPG